MGLACHILHSLKRNPRCFRAQVGETSIFGVFCSFLAWSWGKGWEEESLAAGSQLWDLPSGAAAQLWSHTLLLQKVVTALDRTWHPEHFFCAQCGAFFGPEGTDWCLPTHCLLEDWGGRGSRETWQRLVPGWRPL